MSGTNELLAKYGQAAEYLPLRLRTFAMGLSREEKLRSQEFRLRAGRELSIYISGREKSVSAGERVSCEELQTVLELATGCSVHSAQSSLGKGYVTVHGGHRIGLCGTIVKSHSGDFGIRDLSSVSIRIAKSISYAAEGMIDAVIRDGVFYNTLIISPPGFGKTTALRDLVRRISDKGYRISLVDERGEIAAKHRGVAQFDVGRCTDVLDGIGKAQGAMLMLRAMTPDIIALDEITDACDTEAVEAIANCGVGILATAHGESAGEIFARPSYQRLSRLNVFKLAIILGKNGDVFTHRITEL